MDTHGSTASAIPSSPRPDDFFEKFVLPVLIIFPIPLLSLLFCRTSMARYPQLAEAAGWIGSLSIFLIATSVGAIVVVAILVALSLRSQRTQYLSLSVSWSALKLICLFQVIGQGVLVTALSYYVTVVYADRYIPKLIILVGVMVAIAVFALIRATFQSFPQEHELTGHRLDPNRLGRLGDKLSTICRAMNIPLPDNIIVGIDDNFFVTEASIRVNKRLCEGRTLFLSLPLLGKLSLDEANAIFAHEMAHLSGSDTEHSRRIGPLIHRFDAYLEALHGGITLPVFYFMLFFRALFEVSLSKVSRTRELRADRIAAQLVSREALGLSLAKVSAFCAYREEIESTLFDHNDHISQLNLPQRMETGFDRFIANYDLEGELFFRHVAHPFDSHPTLADRLQSVGCDPDIISKGSIARKPTETWRDALDNADAIESQMWSEYEKEFKTAHEEVRAFRLRPDNEEEAAVVRQLFPDRVIEGTKDTVFAIDYTSLSYSEWDSKIAMSDITDIKLQQEIGGDKLHIKTSLRGKPVYVLPLKPFAKTGEDLTDLIGFYYSRHLVSKEYANAHPKPKSRPKAIQPTPKQPSHNNPNSPSESQKPRDIQRPTISVPTLGGVEPIAATVPLLSENPSPAPLSTQRPQAHRIQAPPVLPGFINGRYEVLDPVDEWDIGHLQRCSDRKTGESLWAVRICSATNANQHTVERIKKSANVRIPGIVTPLRMATAMHYQSRSPSSLLCDGDLILFFPDRGTQPILSTRAFAGNQPVSLPIAMRALRLTGEALDECVRADLDISHLSLGHVHLDAGNNLALYLAAPFLQIRDNEPADRLLASNHPQNQQSATHIAVLSCILLTEPGDRRLHLVNGGEHRVIIKLPHAVNRLIAEQLDPQQEGPHITADSFLDALQVSHRVRVEDYLSQQQLRRLRHELSLDDAGVLQIIRAGVERSRPGQVLLWDQNPVPLQDRDIRDAISRFGEREQDDRRQLRIETINKALLIGGAVISLVILCIWGFGNSALEPSYQPLPESIGKGKIRGSFTTGSSFDLDMPHCLRYLPPGLSAAAYYIQFSDVPSHSLRMDVLDDDNNQIYSYSASLNTTTGYAYVHFPTIGRPDLKIVTAAIYLGAERVYEQSIPVANPWFGSFGRTLLTLIGFWSALLATNHFAIPHLFRNQKEDI